MLESIQIKKLNAMIGKSSFFNPFREFLGGVKKQEKKDEALP
jgi:hypothetical protein